MAQSRQSTTNKTVYHIGTTAQHSKCGTQMAQYRLRVGISTEECIDATAHHGYHGTMKAR